MIYKPSPQSLLPPLPEAGEGKRGSDGYLGYLLNQAAHAHRVRSDRAMADLGVTQPQFLVLTMLAAYPGHSNADLARMALLTPQTVSVTVRNLMKAGLVTRKAHDHHGRIQHLSLTGAGQTLLGAARERMHRIEANMTRGLSAADERAIRRWLVDAATGAA